MRNEVCQQIYYRAKTVRESEVFKNHLKQASKIINTWPRWKQEVSGIGYFGIRVDNIK